MADTLPDITVPSDTWVSVYTETGISVGASVSITNKSSQEVLIQEVLNQPANVDNNGKIISTINTGTYQATVTGTPTGVWLKSSGNNSALVNVQEI